MDLNDIFLPSREVRRRYAVSDMCLWRWLRRPDLEFPKPIIINGRRLWKLSELQAWKSAVRSGRLLKCRPPTAIARPVGSAPRFAEDRANEHAHEGAPRPTCGWACL